jgi:hypothetical protein
MTSSRPGWTRLALLALLTALLTAAFGAPSAGAASTGASSEARSAAAAERYATSRARAALVLEGRRRHLARCIARHPNRCTRWQTAVERTERRLGLAETRVAGALSAPVVTLSGQTLSWAPVAGASAYVLKRRTPALRGNRLLVYGTSVSPTALPGETVEYLVRTASPGSEWSQAVTITYPATTPPSGEPGSGEGSGSVPGGGSGSGSGSGLESGYGQ